MIRSPVSPESPLRGKDGGGAFARIHGYEDGLEVAANQSREKSDLDPVVVLDDAAARQGRDGAPVDVVHGRWREAPQVIDTTAPQAMGDAPLEPTLSNTVTRTGTRSSRGHDGAAVEKGPQGEEQVEKAPKRYCGVGLKVFLLIVVLVILLVAAIIGGAVGGTQARKKSSSSAQTSPSSPAPQDNLTLSTRTSSSTGTPSPSPHVRFRLQTYEQKSFRGSSQLFTEPGLFRPAFPIASYIWSNSKQGDLQDPTPLLRCSFGFCANGTLNAWRGASDARRTGEEANFKIDSNFIVIGCDLVYAEPDCRASGLGKVGASATVSTVPVMETPPTNPDDEPVMGTSTLASASAQVTSRGSASGGAKTSTSTSASRSEEPRATADTTTKT